MRKVQEEGAGVKYNTRGRSMRNKRMKHEEGACGRCKKKEQE